MTFFFNGCEITMELLGSIKDFKNTEKILLDESRRYIKVNSYYTDGKFEYLEGGNYLRKKLQITGATFILNKKIDPLSNTIRFVLYMSNSCFLGKTNIWKLQKFLGESFNAQEFIAAVYLFPCFEELLNELEEVEKGNKYTPESLFEIFKTVVCHFMSRPWQGDTFIMKKKVKALFEKQGIENLSKIEIEIFEDFLTDILESIREKADQNMQFFYHEAC